MVRGPCNLEINPDFKFEIRIRNSCFEFISQLKNAIKVYRYNFSILLKRTLLLNDMLPYLLLKKLQQTFKRCHRTGGKRAVGAP